MDRVVEKRTLLHDERSIVLQPEIVRRLGNLADAAVLQQLNYWMPKAKVEHGGRVWVYKTYENWAKEIGITEHQVRRCIERLESLGIVSSCVPRGRTKHYAINYDHPMLDGASSPDPDVANLPDDAARLPDDAARLPAYKEVTETNRDSTLAAAPRESVKLKAPRPADPLWDTMLAVCRIDSRTITGSERGRINKALKDLREVGATPAELESKAAAYRKKYPEVAMTPTALAANWSQLASAGGVRKNICELCAQRLDNHDEEVCQIVQRGR